MVEMKKSITKTVLEQSLIWVILQPGSMELHYLPHGTADDLQIHLIHEVVLPFVEEVPKEPAEEEDEDSIPSIGIIAVIGITMFAAAIVQQRQQ